MLTETPQKLKLDAFENWLNENNIKLNNIIQLKYTQDYGFSIYANKSIKKGESIVKVPRKIMMTFRDALDHVTLGPLIEAHPFIKSNQSLCVALLLLLESDNENSKWAPYIDILKESCTDINHLPIFYPEELLEKMNKLLIYHVVVEVRKNITNLFSKLNPIISSILPELTPDRFTWAISVLMSRQNHIRHAYFPDPIIALIPIYDMFNHIEIPGSDVTTFYDVGSEISETTSPKAYAKGEQVFITYGKRSNQDLFLYAGFVGESVAENDEMSMLLPTMSLKVKELAHVSNRCTLGYSLAQCKSLLRCVYMRQLGESDKNATGENLISDGVVKKVKEWLNVRFLLLSTSHGRVHEALQKEIEDEKNASLLKQLRLISGMVSVEHSHLMSLLQQLSAISDSDFKHLFET